MFALAVMSSSSAVIIGSAASSLALFNGGRRALLSTSTAVSSKGADGLAGEMISYARSRWRAVGPVQARRAMHRHAFNPST